MNVWSADRITLPLPNVEICRWSNTYAVSSQTPSGVTRAGVTRGGKWHCRPYFSPKKLTTFLIIAACKVITFFSCPTSFVHCFFFQIHSHFKKFHSGVTPTSFQSVILRKNRFHIPLAGRIFPPDRCCWNLFFR